MSITATDVVHLDGHDVWLDATTGNVTVDLNGVRWICHEDDVETFAADEGPDSVYQLMYDGLQLIRA